MGRASASAVGARVARAIEVRRKRILTLSLVVSGV